MQLWNPTDAVVGGRAELAAAVGRQVLRGRPRRRGARPLRPGLLGAFARAQDRRVWWNPTGHTVLNIVTSRVLAKRANVSLSLSREPVRTLSLAF